MRNISIRKTKMKAIDLSNAAICLIVALMPFHYLLCEQVVSNTNIDNLWRDMLIIIMFMLSMLKKRIPRYGLLLLAVSGIVCIISLTSHDLFFGLDTARSYVVPMLIYFGALLWCTCYNRLRLVLRIVTGTGCIIAIWGIVEALFLGADFMQALGYDLSSASAFYINGFYGIPRVLGTFVSPNDAGAFYAVAFICSWYIDYSRISLCWFVRCSILLALLLTFSRSAMVALVCALIVMLVMKRNRNDVRKRSRGEPKALPFLLGIGTCAGFIAFLLFGGQYSEMVVQHAINTFAGTDASANKHVEDLFAPIATIMNNPLGLGFGNNGPRALAEFGTASLVESSIYMVMYDMGILFGIIYFLPYIMRLFHNIGESRVCELPILLSVLCLIIYTLLPSIQNYILPFYFFLICGCVDSLHYPDNVHDGTIEELA